MTRMLKTVRTMLPLMRELPARPAEGEKTPLSAKALESTMTLKEWN